MVLSKVNPPPLLSVENLSVTYHRGRTSVAALHNVSLQLFHGERVAVVGESGSGKTTLARAIAGLVPVCGGTIRIQGQVRGTSGRRPVENGRSTVQMVFQDAAGSLNAHMRVGQMLREVLRVHRRVASAAEADARAQHLLAQVGLPAGVLSAYPGELSGGQCQRVSLARALALQPALLIADEPVSALDVSVQARVLQLLQHLSESLPLACLLIAHDLAMVRHVCERIVVLHQGRIIESGATATLLSRPQHPYTQALLEAVPDLDRALNTRFP